MYEIARVEAHTVHDVYLTNGERFRRDEHGAWALLFYDEWLRFSGSLTQQLEQDYHAYQEDHATDHQT